MSSVQLYKAMYQGSAEVGFGYTLRLLAEIAADAAEKMEDDDKQMLYEDISYRISKLSERVMTLEDAEV